MKKLALAAITALSITGYAQDTKKKVPIHPVGHFHAEELECYKNLLNAKISNKMDSDTRDAIRRDSSKLIQELTDSKDNYLIPKSMVALNSCMHVPGLEKAAERKIHELYPNSRGSGSGAGGNTTR